MDPDYEIEVEPYREGRLNVRIVRGRYVTGFDVSLHEAETLIETLRDALSAEEDSREANAPEPLPHWWHQCRKATFSEHVASCRTPKSWGDPGLTPDHADRSMT